MDEPARKSFADSENAKDHGRRVVVDVKIAVVWMEEGGSGGKYVAARRAVKWQQGPLQV
jgi:hypothetical protein